MPLIQTFETTIYNPDLRVAADVFVLPKRTFDAILAKPNDIDYVLGLDLGVRVPSPEMLPTVFFAAMAGRTAVFEPESFERWQRQMQPADPRAEFARQLAFDELMPVENSPLEKVSMSSLAVRCPAYVVAGSEMWASHPMQALGVVVLGEIGAVVVGIARGFGDSAAIAAKYHTRRLLRVPPDWTPPEDRP